VKLSVYNILGCEETVLVNEENLAAIAIQDGMQGICQVVSTFIG
jgi:hypothetical protein